MSLISLSVFLSSLQRLCFLKIPAAISQIWWSNFYWLGGRHRRQPDGKAIVLEHRKHKRKCKIGSEIFHIAQTALTAQFWSAMETIMRSVMGLVMGKSISHWIGCCVRHRVSQGVRKRLNIWIYVFTAFLFAVLLLISANIWQFQSYVTISSALHRTFTLTKTCQSETKNQCPKIYIYKNNVYCLIYYASVKWSTCYNHWTKNI